MGDLSRDGKSTSTISYKHEFFVRRHGSANCAVDESCEKDLGNDWKPCIRIFHCPARPAWNSVDAILAGDLPMPAALPYPIPPPSANITDRCPGWQLRSAIKQHLYVLIPQDAKERSHEEYLAYALREYGG